MANILTAAERSTWRKLYRAGYRTHQDAQSGLWCVQRSDGTQLTTWCPYRDLAVAQLLVGLQQLDQAIRNTAGG